MSLEGCTYTWSKHKNDLKTRVAFYEVTKAVSSSGVNPVLTGTGAITNTKEPYY